MGHLSIAVCCDGPVAHSEKTQQLMTDHKSGLVRKMEETVKSHGEVHAEFDNHDDVEIELRRGQTAFNYDIGVIEVSGPDSTHYFGMNSLSDFYPPKTIFDEN